MSFSPKIIAAIVVLGLSMTGAAVCAQDAGSMAPAPASTSMGPMGYGMGQGKTIHRPLHTPINASMHKMPATVTSVDKATGMVEATSEGMSLRVHFPPASVANLKAGEKIILHLGYSVSQ